MSSFGFTATPMESMATSKKPTAKLLQSAAERCMSYLDRQLGCKPYLQQAEKDPSLHFKLPALLTATGEPAKALQCLSWIRESMGSRWALPASENPAFAEFAAVQWTWPLIAAQSLEQYDSAWQIYHLLMGHYHPELGGYTPGQPYGQGEESVDLYTTASVGDACLTLGALDKARRAGNLLTGFLTTQPNLAYGFFLRMDAQGKLITSYPDEAAVFLEVNIDRENQAFYMLGKAATFLINLSLATNEKRYFDSAKGYLTFLSQCHPSIHRFVFSHQVMVAAAKCARLSQEQEKVYLQLAENIAESLLKSQNDEGTWLDEQGQWLSIDQSIEISFCLQKASGLIEPAWVNSDSTTASASA